MIFIEKSTQKLVFIFLLSCFLILIASVIILLFSLKNKEAADLPKSAVLNKKSLEQMKQELNIKLKEMKHLVEKGDFIEALISVQQELFRIKNQKNFEIYQLQLMLNYWALTTYTIDKTQTNKSFSEALFFRDQIYGIDYQRIIEESNSFYLYSYQDCVIDNLEIGKEEPEILKTYGKPLSVKFGKFDDVVMEEKNFYKKLNYKDFSLVLTKGRMDRYFYLVKINVTANNYWTYRQITVGDDINKILLSYGYPAEATEGKKTYLLLVQDKNGHFLARKLVFILDEQKKIKEIVLSYAVL